MRQIKLIAGQMNVLRTVLKPGRAEGSNLTKGYAGLKNRDAEKVQFNKPVLCISLRKSQFKAA